MKIVNETYLPTPWIDDIASRVELSTADAGAATLLVLEGDSDTCEGYAILGPGGPVIILWAGRGWLRINPSMAEEFLHVLAHEARHIDQFVGQWFLDNETEEAEEDAEAHADRVLTAWRSEVRDRRSTAAATPLRPC